MIATLIALYVICLVVGLLVGSTGMGGILIPPALVLLSGLETHVAMGTTLASFIPMNLVGCYLFWRMGHLDFKQALPLCLGGALSAGLFALLNNQIGANALTILLAILVLMAGYSAYKPAAPSANAKAKLWIKPWGLFTIGFVTGIAAGLTGAGGPLLAIAWMITCSMHPLAAIGLSMPYSIASALSATVSNFINHNLDFLCLVVVSSIELIGFLIGVILIRKMPVLFIKRLMAITCIVLGLFLLLKTIIWQI
ncbi:MAG: sulfite exporter TauE/SafE family protein [Desulfovibrionaceae bacterium]|nr:sulfite exporter TauE/SafE family protein [Desulfovibrionaceae bacterium]